MSEKKILQTSAADFFKRRKFSMDKTIQEIEEYANAHFNVGRNDSDKVFYSYTEWYGWRFYLKALRHKDWKSIKGHIKSVYLPTPKKLKEWKTP